MINKHWRCEQSTMTQKRNGMRKQIEFPRGSDFNASHVTSIANVESIKRKSTTV